MSEDKCYCYESDESDCEYDEFRCVSGIGSGDFSIDEWSISGTVLCRVLNLKYDECFYVLCEDVRNFKDEIVAKAINATNTRALIATCVYNSDSEFLSILIKKFSNLEVIVFTSFISVEEVTAFSGMKPKLRPLEVMDDDFFTKELLEALRSCSQLKALDLSYRRCDINKERIQNVLPNVEIVMRDGFPNRN